MATQTDFQALPLATPQDFMTPTAIDDLPLPPPPEFTDDDSDEEMTPHEKLKLSKRKSTAKWNIKHGIKKLEDYNQTTWRTIRKSKPLTEAQRRALYTRRCQAQKYIREGTKTREDYDENYYQIKRKTYNLVILD